MNLIVSVCVSICMEQLGSQQPDFHENPTRIMVTLHYYLCTFVTISRSVLRMRTVSDKIVEKIKTLILCSRTFFQKLCHLWDNVGWCSRARQATDDNIIKCMCFACWITKATGTHSEYLILIPFPHQQWLRDHASVLSNMYIACLVGTTVACLLKVILCIAFSV